MALVPGWPGTEMPYSVSVPITRRTLMRKAYKGVPTEPSVARVIGPRAAGMPRHAGVPGHRRARGVPRTARCPPGQHSAGTAAKLAGGQRAAFPGPAALQVLAGVGNGVDRASCLGALLAGNQRPDVDDPLALLAGDARP